MGLPWRCESGAFLGIFLSFKPDQNNADIRLLIYTGTRARFYRALSNLSWTLEARAQRTSLLVYNNNYGRAQVRLDPSHTTDGSFRSCCQHWHCQNNLN